MKKILISLFTIVISLFCINTASAASANISVSASSNRVIVGNTVTITVKVSSGSPLGSWQFDVVASSNLTFVSANTSSGGSYVVDVAGNANQTSKTYTLVYKAKSSGNATVSIKNASVLGYDENKMTTTLGSTSFKTMTKAEIEAGYSKNNNLSKLEVEGYTLTPNFNKDTLEYNLDVENGIESVNIIATKEDNTASIKGNGTVSVAEGINVLKVVVTAQNGSTKTYTINLNVKELSPIEVMVEGKKYTVVRKKEFMPKASIYYEEGTVKISDEDVPSYYNSTINYTLVALKDEQGNITLFRYNDGKYEKYIELSFNQISILPMPMDSLKGYEQVNVKIGDSAFVGFKKGDNYPLIYGMNIETGEKGLYSYDEKENTIQRFVENNTSSFETNLYFYGVIGLSSLLIITYIVIVIALINKGKRKKQRLEQTMKLQNNFKMPDMKKEEVLSKTMVDIGGASPSKREEIKISSEERANLLGKTRYDIGVITSYKDEKVLSKKELKQEKKNAKKESKQNKKNKIDKDGMADF